MKKMMLAALAAAVVGVPRAQALYHEAVLQTGAAYTFRIGNASPGAQVRLLSITRGRLELEDSRLVAAGSSADVPFTVPARATRVLLVIDLKCTEAGCGEATVTVLDANGGTVAAPVSHQGDHFEVGFDVTS